MEIGPLTHPKSIWTWPANNKGKVVVWLPYLEEIFFHRGVWVARYRGGELRLDLRKIQSIQLYGAAGSMPIQFLDDLSRKGIILEVHRKNLSRGSTVLPYRYKALPSEDLLTQQILARQNEKRRLYVARTIIHARLASMQSVIPLSSTVLSDLRRCRHIAAVRVIEAVVSKRYWAAWGTLCGQASFRRRSRNPLSQALDACSVFMTGLILRWLTLHHLSPAHGFMHVPVVYMALCYDLIEPYRFWMEDAVRKASLDVGAATDVLLPASIEQLKKALDAVAYDTSSRTYTHRKAFLHGAVLALRSYLLGYCSRLILPVEGAAPSVGRPKKLGYSLPAGQKQKAT